MCFNVRNGSRHGGIRQNLCKTKWWMFRWNPSTPFCTSHGQWRCYWKSGLSSQFLWYRSSHGADLGWRYSPAWHTSTHLPEPNAKFACTGIGQLVVWKSKVKIIQRFTATQDTQKCAEAMCITLWLTFITYNARWNIFFFSEHHIGDNISVSFTPMRVKRWSIRNSEPNTTSLATKEDIRREG